MPRTTTITLDDDLAHKLETEAKNSGQPLEAVLDQTLRRGLGESSAIPFRVTPKKMGVRPGLNLECIAQLLDDVEGPLRR
jgi:hypothetical protein